MIIMVVYIFLSKELDDKIKNTIDETNEIVKDMGFIKQCKHIITSFDASLAQFNARPGYCINVLDTKAALGASHKSKSKMVMK